MCPVKKVDIFWPGIFCFVFSLNNARSVKEFRLYREQGPPSSQHCERTYMTPQAQVALDARDSALQHQRRRERQSQARSLKGTSSVVKLLPQVLSYSTPHLIKLSDMFINSYDSLSPR